MSKHITFKARQPAGQLWKPGRSEFCLPNWAYGQYKLFLLKHTDILSVLQKAHPSPSDQEHLMALPTLAWQHLLSCFWSFSFLAFLARKGETLGKQENISFWCQKHLRNRIRCCRRINRFPRRPFVLLLSDPLIRKSVDAIHGIGPVYDQSITVIFVPQEQGVQRLTG